MVFFSSSKKKVFANEKHRFFFYARLEYTNYTCRHKLVQHKKNAAFEHIIHSLHGFDRCIVFCLLSIWQNINAMNDA